MSWDQIAENLMSLEFFYKQFDELTISELYQILQLRSDVFVIEQDCIYRDMDDKDQIAIHVLGKQGNHVVAYARFFAAGDYFEGACSFGRVVNAIRLRGQGIGKLLVARCIEQCQQRWPGVKIEISGQLYLEKFYQSFGMHPQGAIYLEDGIEHKRFILA